ncbi:metallophosphoesterase [Ramlibacter humi]|uniref:Phosphoesterase n=1 Tax=Ramlibacter humi TaxID=2530451 RepID=A0A4Z0BEK7_9BURK|nr:metallophosphoesterase [Ramlibacter humi]TFY97742.1 phosphoesterase [Ramlibacter humi]
MNVGGIVVEEACVVSDLHLGGQAPFQIFQQGAALAALIDDLRSRAAPGARRAFVINGDFVDFLAESPSLHFDPIGAGTKLRRIAADPAFAMVFQALQRFVRQPGCLLGIVLGNHDIELALPWVRQELQDLLCGADEAASGRIAWALDGQGLLLRIHGPDGPRVLCTHGNEVDGWNVVEHEALRKIGRAGQRDQALDLDYKPNPGSRMVVDVMNAVKRRFPFVDLLKPETEAVIPILGTLDPSLLKKLSDIAEFKVRKAANDARIAAGLLGDDGREALAPQEGAASLLVQPAALKAATAGEKQAAGRQLLDAAEERLQAGHAAIDLVEAAERGVSLGLWSTAVRYATSGGDKVEALRGRLRDLAKDRSFELQDEDETYRGLCERVSPSIDYLVTGHTHLARAITRDFPRSYYFNTGTWARVFRMDPAVLEAPDAFRGVYTALGAGNIAALDRAPGLVPVRPHYAAFWCDAAGGTHGELRQVKDTAPFAFEAVPGTSFSRS